MSDEIRIYHVDDPNDAPERRLASLPTLNPFIPTSLPQYVIPPVANSLYNAMQYYWYTAYQQGFAAQQQQHQHQQQIRLQQRQQQQPVEQTLNPAANNRHVVEDPSTINHLNTNNRQRQASPQRILCHASSSTSSSSSSSMSPQQLSSPQNHHHHSVSSTTVGNNHLHNHQLHQQIASSTSPDNQLFPTSQLASTNHLHNQRQHHHNHHHHLHHLQPHDQLHSPALSDTQPLSHDSSAPSSQQQHNNHQHIKKPLNPFMIYMQKQRPEIVKQGIIKESAAINQLLGQQWRKLSREEQEPYYKLAEQEKRLHAEKYPGWSARDNYANQKRRKKMRLRAISMNGATNCVDLSDKKCRARFGLSNMASWCKPCKRKKRCIYSLPKSSRHRSSTEQ